MIGESFGCVLRGVESSLIKVRAEATPCSTSEMKRTRINGLSEYAERETRLRINAAFTFDNHSIEVWIDDLPENVDTNQLDLPIAVAILRSLGREPFGASDSVYVGELSLEGRIRPVRGAICYARQRSRLILAWGNAREAALSPLVDAHVIERLTDLLDERNPVRIEHASFNPYNPEPINVAPNHRALLEELRGARRVLLEGSPGSGRTLLARALGDRALNGFEASEAARIHSVAGLLHDREPSLKAPFRAPHHSVSMAGLVGGGLKPRPGEISLAHQGTLYLDELIEFRRESIVALAGVLHQRWAAFRGDVSFPAEPKLVIASVHHCPCGYRGSAHRECRCSPDSLKRHEARVSEYARKLGMTRVDVPDADLLASGKEDAML